MIASATLSRMVSPLAERRFGFLHVFALAALIFAVAAFNGRPSFFGDTPIYYSQGEYLATALGFPSPQMTPQRRADPYSVVPGSLGFVNRRAVAVAAARSPVYGLLLFLTERLGTLWLLVGVQALAASWALYIFIRSIAPRATLRAFYASGVVLAFGSSLPFFAAFAMPDIFAGVNILCAVTILLFAERLSWGERAGAWALICFGAAAHMSNALTLLSFAIVAAGVLAMMRQPWTRIAARCGALVLAVAAALCATALCGKIYERGTGVRQVSPPFLMARVLADGPGRTYLATHCPNGAAPLLCRYAGRTFQDQEEFLWSTKPTVGVYALLDYGTQQRLKREEITFVLHAVVEHPMLEAIAMVRNWGQQLTLFTLIEPAHNPAEFLIQKGWRTTSSWQILPGHAECEQTPARCEPRLPVGGLRLWQTLVMLITLVTLAVARTSSDLRAAIAQTDPARRTEIEVAAKGIWLIVLGVLLNAAVCGALSGPFPRYEARLIWLLPLSAVLLFQLLPWREALMQMRRGAHQERSLEPFAG